MRATTIRRWSRYSCSINAAAIGFAFAVAGALAIGAVLFDLVLFADGAYFFIEQLQTTDFHLFSPARRHAEYFFQLPMQLALELGVTNPLVLLKLHGIGAYWLPLASILFCSLYSRDPLFTLIVLLAFGLSHLSVWSLAVSEAHFAAALFWMSAALLGGSRGLGLLQLCSLVLLSVLMIRSYESHLLFAPILLFALYLNRRLLRTPLQNITAALLVVSLLIGAVFALSEILNARDAGNRDQFVGSIFQVATEYYLLHFIVASAVLLLLLRKKLPERLSILLVAGLGLVTLVVAYLLVRRSDFYIGAIIYSCRVLLMLVPAGLYVLYLLLSQVAADSRRSATAVAAGLVMLTFATQAVVQLETMRQWYGYQRIFKEVLSQHQGAGMIDVAQTRLGLERQDGVALSRQRWPGWTLPLLSVIWSGDRVVTTGLFDIHAGFVPYTGGLPRLPDQFGFQYYPFHAGQPPSFRDPGFQFEAWNSPEMLFLWSEGSTARVLFNVSNPQRMTGRILLDVGTFGIQRVSALLNGLPVAEFLLHNNPSYRIIPYDPAMLVLGENVLEFRFADARRPNAQDPRLLAMYLRHLAIE